MSTNLTFYADLRSQPCRAIYLFLKLNKIPFKMEKVDLSKGEHLSERFTALCGLQTVPVIDDNGFALGERKQTENRFEYAPGRKLIGHHTCSAILRYLAKKFSVPDHWYPMKDSQRQARLEEYLYWHGGNTRPNAMWTFRHQCFPVISGEPVNQEDVEKYKTALAKTLHRIDTYFMKENPFIVGTEISVADLQVLCELMQLDIIENQHLYLSNPKIKDWVERVKGEIGPCLDDCLNQGFWDFKAKYEMAVKGKK